MGGGREFSDLEIVLKGGVRSPGGCLVPDPECGSIIPWRAFRQRFFVLAGGQNEAEREDDQTAYDAGRIDVVGG